MPAAARAMDTGPNLKGLLRRDRAIVVVGLALATVLAWAYTIHLAGAMRGGMGTAMVMAEPHPAPWGATELAATFVMWTIMMVAMMVPSAAPMILLFTSLARRRRQRSDAAVYATMFVLGYLLVWTGFSLVATLAQWALHDAALITPGMATAVPAVGGLILIAAGAYQWTPWKQSCLRQCRSPLGFITTEWREGCRGALVMGLRHGTFCLGCCWLLMALLFVAGVMNVAWVWVIAVFVLLEKLTPIGRTISLAAGPALAFWGVWLLTRVGAVG